MTNRNLVVASQLRPFLLLPNAYGKVLSSPFGYPMRLCFRCEEVKSRTYHDGQTKGFEICFRHKVIAIGALLENQTIQEWVPEAVDAEQ